MSSYGKSTKASNNGLPKSRDAEQAVLGCVLQDARCLDTVLSLREDHFTGYAEQAVWKAFRDLRAAGKPIDLVILAEHLQPKIADLGGYSYLAELQGSVATAAHVEHYARILAEKLELRQRILAAHRILASHGRDLSALHELAAPPVSAVGTVLREVDAGQLAHDGAGLHLDYLPLLGGDGYMVKGWSHLIAGYPRAGKTELVAACCRDWLAMGETIVYLTEEPEVIWRHRLARAKDAWAGMRLIFGLGADPAALLARMRDGQETIAVVDTIRGLAVTHGDENDNAALARQLTPWVAAARDRRKSLILMHHDRKGGGEHGEAIAGGHAILGAVDIALELVRDSAPARRLIRAYARIIQPAELMYERQQDGTMKALGTPECVGLGEVRRRVLEAVDEEWAKTREVWERLAEPRPSQEQVRKALLAEAEAGTVERDPPVSERDAKGKTVRWRRGGGGANLTSNL